jgi:hypothetical protein
MNLAYRYHRVKGKIGSEFALTNIPVIIAKPGQPPEVIPGQCSEREPGVKTMATGAPNVEMNKQAEWIHSALCFGNCNHCSFGPRGGISAKG